MSEPIYYPSIYSYTCILTYTYTHIFVYLPMNICTHVHTHAHMWAHTYIFTCNTYVQTHSLSHIYVWISISICIITFRLFPSQALRLDFPMAGEQARIIMWRLSCSLFRGCIHPSSMSSLVWGLPSRAALGVPIRSRASGEPHTCQFF